MEVIYLNQNKCNACPRLCNVVRTKEEFGVCGVSADLMVARASVHHFEEPCISGINGSGTIFFSGCSLKCVYCQNKDISFDRKGKYITHERFNKIVDNLINEGVHNINLVNPTHYADVLSQLLSRKVSVPIVYNTGGYDKVESIAKLRDKIDIYLVDLKYSDDTLAKKYSKASDYFEVAKNAIKEMYKQVGDYIIDSNGIMQKGVIIRHLILPDSLENSYGVIDWVSENFINGQVKFSLMSQYTPIEKYQYQELNRTITQEEYDKVIGYMYLCGINDGYTQELSSANDIYIPDFDFSGI